MDVTESQEGSGGVGDREDVESQAAQRTPTYHGESFTCPYPRCRVYAKQRWSPMLYYADSGWEDAPGYAHVDDWDISICEACGEPAMWRKEALVYPLAAHGPAAHSDLTGRARSLYEEARSVAHLSQKSTAALLRLTLQVLVDELVPEKGSIDSKIGQLVGRGLDPMVQKAMDYVRVIGNNAVHPGQIDLEAQDDVTTPLFELINLIVDQMITRPRMIKDLFESLPEGARGAIERRDGRPSA